MDLAVQNTNLKAYALTFGPAAQAVHEVDDALGHLVVESARSTAAGAKQVMLLAAGAECAALRIQTELAPHIADESDEKMDAPTADSLN